MDTYSQIVSFLSGLPEFSIWSEMLTNVQKVATGNPRQWKLADIASQAMGREPGEALFAMAAMACLHISIILVDDMLDIDPRGEYVYIGAPATANLALAFQAAGMGVIFQSNLLLSSKLAAVEILNWMVQQTAFGQYLDTHPVVDEASYWRVVQLKSSPFFGASLFTGALAGGATIEVARQFLQLGNLYGEIIQIHDDLSDSLAVPANPDWVQRRASLPILYATLVDHPDRKRFLSLQQEVIDPKKLNEAQIILVHCGAISYCIDCIRRKHQEALSLLKTIPINNPKPIRAEINALILPVEKLLDQIEHAG